MKNINSINPTRHLFAGTKMNRTLASVSVVSMFILAMGCSDEFSHLSAPGDDAAIGYTHESDAFAEEVSETVEVSEVDPSVPEDDPQAPQIEPGPEDADPSAPAPSDAENERDTWANDVDDLVTSMGIFEPGEPSNGGVTAGPESDPEQSGNFVCTVQSMTQTAQFTEYIASQVNSNSLWVGSLVRGQALTTGMLTEARAPRAPITVSVSLDNLNGPASVNIERPSLSAYREGVRALLADGIEGSQPAQMTYSAETIHSEEHLGLFLGTDVSAGNVDVAASFDFSRSDVRSRVMVNFVQAYYTVDMDAFGRASDFFRPLTDLDRIENAFGGDEAEAPLYVSSITYGRRVIFTAESTASAKELKAALDFAYSGGVVDVDVDARLSHEEILQESSIQAFILGGNAEDAVEAVDGLSGIQQFITAGGTFSSESPGAPIAYKLNHLDDNSAARISLTTDYVKETCERAKQNVKVTLKGITPVNGQNRAKTYGRIFVSSFDVDGNQAHRHDLFNVHKDHRIEMRENTEWQPSSVGTARTVGAIASQDPDAAGALIQIKIDLKEYDWGSRDDEASADLRLTAATGWRHGCGQGEDLVVRAAGRRQNYDIRLCLTPMSD